MHRESAGGGEFQQRDRWEQKHPPEPKKHKGPPELEIKETRRTEQRLPQECDFFLAILDTTDMLVVALDRQGRIVHFNPACERLSGYSFEEVKGRQVWDFLIRPEEVEAVQATFEKLRADGISNELENYWVTKNGDLRLIAWSNTVLLDDEDQIEYIIGTGLNITDRKEQEERAQFQAELLDTVGQAVIATTLEGKIIYWNRFAEKLYGWSRSEVMGRNIKDIALAQTCQEQASKIMNELRQGRSWTGECLVRNREGNTFPILITNAPIQNANGELAGIIGVSMDITARKQAEAVRQREVESLEELLGFPKVSITAESFGVRHLQQASPELFRQLVEKYQNLLDLALEEKIFKVEYNISDALRLIAEEVGRLRGGPRDIVNIHVTALKQKLKKEETNSAKAQAYTEEGRLLVLELMGYLVSYYRTLLAGSTPSAGPWQRSARGAEDE